MRYRKKKTVRILIALGIAIFTLISSRYLREDERLEQQSLTSEKVQSEKGSDNIGQVSNPIEDSITTPIELIAANVIRVVDGDTIQVSIDDTTYRVRLIGINTPESTTKKEPYGKEASDFTKSQLEGKIVYLEKDVSDTDRFGRSLRYVWLEPPTELSETEIRDKMFNAVLAVGGYAQQATYPPDVKYVDYFKKFAAEARSENKGLWAIKNAGTADNERAVSKSNSSTAENSSTSSSSAVQPSSEERQYVDENGRGLIKGNINSKNEKIYHIPGSTYYDRTKAQEWFKTKSEAEAEGYRAPLR
jgi:micrococcal nuclease